MLFQDEQVYDEPPALPPRSDDFLEPEAPPLPDRSAEVEHDEEDYEEIDEPPPLPPAETGLPPSRLQLKRLTCEVHVHSLFFYR